MSNIVWDQDKGWHDGPEVKVTAEAGRIKVVLCCWCDAPATRNLDSYYDVACDVHHAQWFADDAGLGVGHIWTAVKCPAYRTLNGNDCTCGSKS